MFYALHQSCCSKMNSYITNLDGSQKAKLALGGVVELFLPVGQGLDTGHHGTIVTVGGRGDEEQDNPRIERNETLVVLPRAIGVEQVVKRTLASVTSDNSTGTHCGNKWGWGVWRVCGGAGKESSDSNQVDRPQAL